VAARTDRLTFELSAGDGPVTPHEFSVVQHPPRAAYKLMARLIRVFGPALAELKDAFKDGNANVDIGKLAGVMQTVCLGLPDSEMDALVAELLTNTTLSVDGKIIQINPKLFDHFFHGSLLDSFKLLGFVVKVNFADFFRDPGGSPAK
jgi:hypothetical protein